MVSQNTLRFPDSPLALNSPFYINRSPSEEWAYQELKKSGSLLRVKAAKKMGKSSLMLRLIDHAQTLGYRTVLIDFIQVDQEIFENTDKFFRWLCINVARKLEIDPKLDDYWDEDMGSKVSCTLYFELYIFPQINCPLFLVFHELNIVFEHPNISQNFLPLIRFWYEQSRHNQAWKNIHLFLVQSTEVYIYLNVHQSPFNIGLSIELPPFTVTQVQNLAERYYLNLSDTQIQTLTHLVGGHPYLVHLAIYHIANHLVILEEFLKKAPTLEGIYKDYLQSLCLILHNKPELAIAMKQVSTSKLGVQLEPIIAYQLYSLGLVNLDENYCTPSCELYRLYFSNQILSETPHISINLKQLQEENKHLKSLVYVDTLTHISNRRQFDRSVEIEWKRMMREIAPLSLILCDIDHFKIYNDTYGHQAGDRCLRIVAQAISDVIQRPGDVVARYGGEEFVIILPQTDAKGAMYIAESIHKAIKTLALPFNSDKLPNRPASIITISLGVASAIPGVDVMDIEALFLATDRALYQAKKNGKDQVKLSSFLRFQY